MRTKDYLHNPFQNRFNVPVTQRLDEMQAVTNMVWLHEPAVVNSSGHADRSEDSANRSRRVNLRLLLLLLIVLISVVALVSAL